MLKFKLPVNALHTTNRELEKSRCIHTIRAYIVIACVWILRYWKVNNLNTCTFV